MAFGATLPARPARLSAEPFHESDVAPTLPPAHSPGFGPADEVATPDVADGSGRGRRDGVRGGGAGGTGEVVRAAPPPASGPDDAATRAGATPFSSSTLAELYFRQGLVDRAVEVYRQVLEEEPDNERARSRLAELESASPPPDARAARRAALERTIAGLEALLVVLQRR